MTFTATHTRAFVGNDIAVTVNASAGEDIAAITVTLDGFELEALELMSGTEQYTRNFSQAGSSAPGMDHSLVVMAVDQKDVPHSATTRWTDS